VVYSAFVKLAVFEKTVDTPLTAPKNTSLTN
jgi:hypothetical protein